MVTIAKKESGFGLLGIIIIVGVIGVLAGGGFYFKELQQQKSLLDIGRDAEKQAQEFKKKIEAEQKKIEQELNDNQGRVCTQEAKQCPDGSSVSRTGPNCEFARCPGISDIVFDQQAEKLCGSQPPILCQSGKQLGCNSETKQWSCYSTVMDVTDWKTYRNEKYGFEVKYPSNFVLVTTYENLYPDQSFTHFYRTYDYQSMLKRKNSEGPPVIQLAIYKNYGKFSAIEWARQNSGHSNFTGDYQSKIFIDHEVISYSWSGLGYGDSIVLVDKDSAFVFNVLYYDKTDPLRNDFPQIFSTFKFIQ